MDGWTGHDNTLWDEYHKTFRLSLCVLGQQAITWTTVLAFVRRLHHLSNIYIYIHRYMIYPTLLPDIFLRVKSSIQPVLHQIYLWDMNPWQTGISITVRVIASWQICQGSWYNQQCGSGAHNFPHKICTPYALDLDLDKLWESVWLSTILTYLCLRWLYYCSFSLMKTILFCFNLYLNMFP